MKDTIKEINEALRAGMAVDGKLELTVDIVDNATYKRATNYIAFMRDSVLKAPVIGLYPTELKFKGDSKVKLVITVTDDYQIPEE